MALKKVKDIKNDKEAQGKIRTGLYLNSTDLFEC